MLACESLVDHYQREGFRFRILIDGDLEVSPSTLTNAQAQEIIDHVDEIIELVKRCDERQRCHIWLCRHLAGKYLSLSAKKAAAIAAGFTPATIDQAIIDPAFVVYRAFPRRGIEEAERIRSAYVWPDDPPLANRH